MEADGSYRYLTEIENLMCSCHGMYNYGLRVSDLNCTASSFKKEKKNLLQLLPQIYYIIKYKLLAENSVTYLMLFFR